MVEAFREWWTVSIIAMLYYLLRIGAQIYKVARGDDVIQIVGETYQNVSYTEYTVAESHKFWMDLVADKVDRNEININQVRRLVLPIVRKVAEVLYLQTYTSNLESFIGSSDATSKLDLPTESKILPAAAVPVEYQEWRFIQDGALVAGPANGNEEEE